MAKPTDGLQLTVERELLAWAVGRTMICRLAGTVLDQKDAVMLTTKKNGVEVGCEVISGAAYDKIADRLVDTMAANGMELEVVDGRELWS
jgi:hypothetical protein